MPHEFLNEDARVNRFRNAGAIFPNILIAMFLGTLSLLGQSVSAPDSIPQRGLVPTGTFAVSDIETVNVTNGNVFYQIPITSLPKARAGFSAGLNLIYNSQAFDLKFSQESSAVTNQLANFARLSASPWGGWQYGFTYGINVDTLPTPVLSCSDPNQSWKQFRLSVISPDGSPHTLHLYPKTPSSPPSPPGRYYSDIAGEGFYDVLPGLASVVCPNVGAPLAAGNVTYFTTDGSYLKVIFNNVPGALFSNIGWTIYTGDGRTITGSGSQASAMVDPSGNTVSIINSFDPNNSSIILQTTIQDDPGRNILIQYNPNKDTSTTDTITQTGADGTALQWTVNWQPVTASASLQYICSDANDYCSGSTVAYRAVTSVKLPTNQNYTFGYDTANGWGEMNSATLPSGAIVQYAWTLNNHFRTDTADMNINPVSGKTVFWNDEDGSGPRTETTAYCVGPTSLDFCTSGQQNTVTSPDGGVARYVFKSLTGQSSRLVAKITQPDGSTNERIWGQNPAYALSFNPTPFYDSNPYVQYEIQSAASGGTATVAAVKAVTVDRNGNQTVVGESDWTGYGNVTHDSSGAPNGFTGGPPPALRTKTNTYFVTANSTGDDPNGYFHEDMILPWGLLTNATVTGSGPGFISKFQYNGPSGHPNLTQEQHWDSATGVWLTTNYTYDSHGNLLTLQNPLGYTTAWTYDTNSLCPQTKVQAQGQAEQRSFTFSCAGNSWGLIASQTDSDHAITRSYTYDAYGRNTLFTESGGGLTRHRVTQYDDPNRQVTIRSDLNNATDATQNGGLATVTWYDQLGRVRQTMDPARNLVQTRYYTPTSKQSFYGSSYRLVSNPYLTGSETSAGWTLTATDRYGNVSIQNCAQGSSTPPSPFSDTGCSGTGTATSTHGASLGMSTTITTDEANNVRTAYFDGLGRMKQVTENGNENTLYSYDALDNLTGVTQPGGQTRSFGYSSVSRLLSASNPESGLACYTYDSNGNLHTRTQGLTGTDCTATGGVTATYAYNALDSMKGKTYSDSTPWVTYGYSFDWLTTVTAGSIVNRNLTFDGFGRVTSSSQTTNGSTWAFPQYAYNLANGLTSVTMPSGRIVSTAYDGAGRASSLQGALGGTKTYAGSITYAPHGAITGMQLGNSLWSSAAFNSRLQVTGMNLGTTALGTDLWSLTNGYSGTQNNGNVMSQALTVPGMGMVTSDYTYDGVNRLSVAAENPANATAPSCGDGVNRWCRQYDYYGGGNGNRRVSATHGQGLSPLEPGSFTGSNQISPLCAAPTNTGCWSYDARGNLTKQATGETFGYDAENRQVAYCTQDANPATCTRTAGAGRTLYFYDGDGRRVLTQAPDGTTTGFAYDAAGNLAAEFGQKALTAAPCTTCFVTVDHLGSTRVMTDGTGCAVFRQDYLPFGETILASGGNPRLNATGGTICGTNGYVAVGSLTRVQFTGQVLDSESGLDYFGARYMSSAQGRFTSPDLVNVTHDRLVNPSNTLNKYIYGGNNPLKYVDPDGRDITVFYEPGVPTGHVMLAASNPQNGDFALLSVGPQQHLDPGILSNPNVGVPGTPTFAIPQSVDELRQNFAALTIQTTPEVAQQAIDAIRNGAGRGNYSLTGNNCSSACAKVLKDIGLSPGSKGFFPWTPSKLWTNLLRNYAKDRNPVANAVLAVTPMIQRVPQRGSDYGNPRYGQDAFSFVFQQEAIHPPTKACVTVQGANGLETSCE